jgi:hypothetical protein
LHLEIAIFSKNAKDFLDIVADAREWTAQRAGIDGDPKLCHHSPVPSAIMTRSLPSWGRIHAVDSNRIRCNKVASGPPSSALSMTRAPARANAEELRK